MSDLTSPQAPIDVAARQRTVVVLRSGFRVTAVLIGAGLLLALVKREPLPREMGAPDEIVQGVLQADPGSVVGLGIVAMIVTPLVATLAISVSYVQDRNRRYAIVSGVVLAILLVSISLSVV